jgi:ABC-2 type transport system permease protein
VNRPAAADTRRPGLVGSLRLVAHQVRYEQLAFWVNRVGAVFTIGFSVVFLVLLGSSAGNSRVSYLGNIRLIQYYVPAFVAYGVMAACFTTLAITMVVRRETGLLKRLRLSPLPTSVLLASIFVSTTIVALVQVVVLLLIGRFGYAVAFPHAWAALVVVLLVGIASFSALGVAMSTAIPNQEAAGPVTSIVFFVLLFLSGLWFPLSAHSGLAKFSTYFPVRHFLLAVAAPFEAQRGVSPWPWHDLLIVAIWGVVGTFIAVRRFHWAPTRS